MAKIDILNHYLKDLKTSIPKDFKDYRGEKLRACERLLQISIEECIMIASKLVKALQLGLPESDSGLFDKLKAENTISSRTAATMKRLHGLRNILVHRYGEINDKLVFENLKNRMQDFDKYITEILAFLKK